MKTIKTLIGAAFVVAALYACRSTDTNQGTSDSATVSVATDSMSSDEMASTMTSSTTVIPGLYTNLVTGKRVYIIRDPETGYAYDSVGRAPVDFYINDSNDTLYRTGQVVNNAIVKYDDGTWKIDETKIKANGDKLKVKDPDSKVKMEDGNEVKVKVGDYKKKVDGDKVKEKDADTKSKTEDGVTTTKPRN